MPRQNDNFAETLFCVQERYAIMFPGEPTEAEGWLFNNILSFMNNNRPALAGYVPGFIKFINRGESTKITNIDSYLRSLDMLDCNIAIMKLWDKMLPEERDIFAGKLIYR